ncbi:hypothetical protein EJ05DRAFT_153578 [Pseudovirgaria hyperparasitica]|uniref:Uncharacterized protein n=1 Tax=Pseudovirgaria hyperparasitica TaxID=470096 RepID=A0A6A6VX04_9PEZI|nr:uncharacterized protein EJ05DRAFT_153578 [Pseudovirgaria hyperparasitica]KAF2754244.1 hypothetical protein EJ05DRAFT_153578 [Pseudovirgaria hyperparasitica]
MNSAHYTGPAHHTYISNRFRRFNNAMFVQQAASPPDTRPPSRDSSARAESDDAVAALHRFSTVSSSSRLSRRSSIRASWSSFRSSLKPTPSSPRVPKQTHIVEPRPAPQRPRRAPSPSSVYSRASTNSSVKFLAVPVSPTTPLPLQRTSVPSTAYVELPTDDPDADLPRVVRSSAGPRARSDVMSMYEVAEAGYWARKDEVTALQRRRRGVSSVGSLGSLGSRGSSAYSSAPPSPT